ncbi:hypothetical protein FGIG_04801 [Fasciola gigantica]|uniref:Uncharacterized protein n=1 Tax=Fasciola gigantica TaxID=46835 RepID=A0A504YPS8_FASGI|nr:hypothetical protein FGIG_04801 [Fasciola gigantica]
MHKSEFSAWSTVPFNLMHRLIVLLFASGICISWAKPHWPPRMSGAPMLGPPVPSPPSIRPHSAEGLFPDLMRRVLPPPPPPPYARTVPVKRVGGWRYSHQYSWQRPDRLGFLSVRPTEKHLPTEYELADDDTVPVVIEEIRTAKSGTDNLVSEESESNSELYNLLMNLLHSLKLKKKPKIKRYYRLPKSIIISQPASESTTSMTTVTQPTGCTCAQPNTATGGTPRSAFPVQPTPFPMPNTQPMANVLPTSATPVSQTPVALPGSNSLSATPRSEIPQSLPTSSTGSGVGTVPVTITQSQTSATLSPKTVSTKKQITQQSTMLSPLLSEIRALLLAGQPSMNSHTEGFELPKSGAVLAPMALTHVPKLELMATPTVMAVPVTAAYSSPTVISEAATDTPSTDAHTSLTSELMQLVNALQQSQHNQQLQQQQQPQQQQQDLSCWTGQNVLS